MAESKRATQNQSNEEAYQAIEKVLTGCVSKVLEKLKRGSSSRSSSGKASHCSQQGACEASASDSDEEFIEKPPFKKKKAERRNEKVYPSSYLNRNRPKPSPSTRPKSSKGKGKGKEITYERDIICLPKSFGASKDLIATPRSKSQRKYLVQNKLLGKLRIRSSMDEEDIFSEIRSVFRKPMRGDESFRFKILQPTGGDTRCLMLPEVSETYKWTAAAVAGRNAKTPVYILAEDSLKLIDDDLLSDEDEEVDSSDDEDPSKLPYVKSRSKHGDVEAANKSEEKNAKDKSGIPGDTPHCSYSRTMSSQKNTHLPKECRNDSSTLGNPTYRNFINLVSDEESSDPNSPPLFTPLTPPDQSEKSVEDLLCLQKTKMLPVDKNVYQRILIRRKHVWKDALRYFRSGIDFKKYLRVTFVGEPAVDEGGPMREFLHILMGAISDQSSLFTGENFRRVPSPNLPALQRGTFKFIGQIFAVSLIYGGPAPFFLASPVLQYIVHGLAKVNASVEDVPEPEVRAKLKQLSEAMTVDGVRGLLESDDFDFLYSVGISAGRDVSLAGRDEIVSSLANHFTVIVVKAQLDQIVEGLQVLGVYDLFKSHPSAMYHLLITLPPPLTATDIIELFQQPIFSEYGSNEREREEQIVMFFAQFIYMLEGHQPLKLKNGSGKEESFHCTYKTLLSFVTGAPYIPPIGFVPQPSLGFHQNKHLPRANTCSCTLYLPVKEELPTFDQFAYNMVFEILNSAGFQRV